MTNRIELYSVKDLKETFQVTRETIYKLRKEGKIKGTKLGGQWFFLKRDIEELFNNEETNN